MSHRIAGLVLLVVLTGIAHGARAAAPDSFRVQRVVGFRGAERSAATAAISTPSGGIVAAGNGADVRSELVSLDRRGRVQWRLALDDLSVRSLELASDGAVLAIGETIADPWTTDGAVTRVEVDGSRSWTRTFGGEGADTPLGSVRSSDGHLWVAGATNSFDDPGFPNRPPYTTFVAELDEAASVLSLRPYFLSFYLPLEPRPAIALAADGGFVLGSLANERYSWWPALMRFDASGALVWSVSSPTRPEAEPLTVDRSPDGGFVLGGYRTIGGQPLGSDAYVAKVSSAGAYLWERTLGGPWNETQGRVLATADGGAWLVSVTDSFGPGARSLYAVRLDSAGQVIDQDTIGGAGNEELSWLRPAPGAGWIAAGRTESFGAAPLGSGYVVRTDVRGKSCPGSGCTPTMVALGDGYAAGEGLGQYVKGSDTAKDKCHRSSLAFPAPRHRVPDVPLREGYVLDHASVACSGATIANLRRGGAKRYGELAQLDRAEVAEAAFFATVTVGREDLGLPGLIDACAARTHCSDTPVSGTTGPTLRQAVRRVLTDELPGALDGLLADVKWSAPNATIVVTGYPQSFPSSVTEQACAKLARFTADEQAFLRDVTSGLNDALGAAAERAGLFFLALEGELAGHEVCGAGGAWITEWSGPGQPAAMQLTKRGHAEVANALTKLVARLLADAAIPTGVLGLPVDPDVAP